MLVAIVEMVPGQAEAGLRYEDAVLALIDRHGGTLERRTRSTDGTAEVHLIRFQSREGLETFMVGPARIAHRVHAGEAAPTTRVTEVVDL